MSRDGATVELVDSAYYSVTSDSGLKVSRGRLLEYMNSCGHGRSR